MGEKQMKKTKLLISIGLALVLVVAAANGIIYLLRVNAYRDAVASITYRHSDATGVPDGTYTGECDVDFIYAKVAVTVKNEVITGIELLEHRNDRGDAASGIEQRIVAEQRVDVDTVSGATNSSTVIKKAVDNALSAVMEGTVD
jgi:uncharacterized protein with FMN-binding domain